MFGLSLAERARRFVDQTIQALPPDCPLRSAILSNQVEFEVFSTQKPMGGLTLLPHQAFAAARYRQKMPALGPTLRSADLAVGLDGQGNERVRLASWIDDRILLGLRLEGVEGEQLRLTLGRVAKIRVLQSPVHDPKPPSDVPADAFIAALTTRIPALHSNLPQGLTDFRIETPTDESLLDLAGESYVIVGQNDIGDCLAVNHGSVELIKLSHDPMTIEVLGVFL